jgi:hypothetical protein
MRFYVSRVPRFSWCVDAPIEVYGFQLDALFWAKTRAPCDFAVGVGLESTEPHGVFVPRRYVNYGNLSADSVATLSL